MFDGRGGAARAKLSGMKPKVERTIAVPLSLYEQSQEQFEYARKKDREQAALTREGHVTERYAEAIKLLATPADSGLMSRLGGIYSLERIMRDSEKDYDTVVQRMTSRPHSRYWCAVPAVENNHWTCRSRTSGAPICHRARAVLAFAQLAAVDFTDANLTNADLRGADLVGDRLGARISVEQLLDTGFDASTKLPLHDYVGHQANDAFADNQDFAAVPRTGIPVSRLSTRRAP